MNSNADKYVKFCPVCNETRQNMDWCDNEKYKEFSKGFHNVFVPKEGLTICPACHRGILVDSILTHKEFDIIEDISDSDRQFLEAMIKLKQDDIIEYQSRMSQFRIQLEREKQVEEEQKFNNTPHCPHCNSTNIKSISGLNRGASIAMWGIFSKKINKSFECLDCKYTW